MRWGKITDITVPGNRAIDFLMNVGFHSLPVSTHKRIDTQRLGTEASRCKQESKQDGPIAPLCKLAWQKRRLTFCLSPLDLGFGIQQVCRITKRFDL